MFILPPFCSFLCHDKPNYECMLHWKQQHTFAIKCRKRSKNSTIYLSKQAFLFSQQLQNNFEKRLPFMCFSFNWNNKYLCCSFMCAMNTETNMLLKLIKTQNNRKFIFLLCILCPFAGSQYKQKCIQVRTY